MIITLNEDYDMEVSTEESSNEDEKDVEMSHEETSVEIPTTLGNHVARIYLLVDAIPLVPLDIIF